MAEDTYSVAALAYHKSGTWELEGYVPFVVRDRGRKIQCFAIYDGNNTGNQQRRCPTPEEAMQYYESCSPKYPGSDDPVKQLVRVNGSTAGAVEDNQSNSTQEESND
jgi:hypothetical protein